MDITTALDLLRRLDADPGRLPELQAEIHALGARLAEAEDASEIRALTSEKQQLTDKADELARELLIAARRDDPLFMDSIVARMTSIDGEIKARMDEVRLLCVELEDLVFKADEAAGIYAAIDSAYDIPFRPYRVLMPSIGWPGWQKALKLYFYRFVELTSHGDPEGALGRWPGNTIKRARERWPRDH